MRFLQPEGWPRPKGYVNGIEAWGQTIFVAGQIGWDEEGRFAPDFVSQFEQTLRNVLAVLQEASAGPEHVVRLNWYITDKQAYIAEARRVGEVYRNLFGRHYPTMTVVQVAGLVEDEALIEIEAIAVKAKDA